MSNQKLYICYWDDIGFEVITDVTNWERDVTMAILKGEDRPEPPVKFEAMAFRAQVNGQRSPNIYTFSTDPHITEDTLWGIANDDPKMLSDLITEKGEKLY